jgi:hypothetical protein
LGFSVLTARRQKLADEITKQCRPKARTLPPTRNSEVQMGNFDKLDAALDAYDQHLAAIARAAETRESEDNQFLADFGSFCTGTAHPALERIGKHLRDRGHDFQVKTDDKPGIVLNIYLAGASRFDSRGAGISHPQFSIRCNVAGRKVEFTGVVVTGNMVGNNSRGTYGLADVTADLVHEKATECIAESFKR